jgi:hypothetical protein
MVPKDLPPQAYALRVSAGGNFSNTFNIPVQAPNP